MTQLTPAARPPAYAEGGVVRVAPQVRDEVRAAVLSFLDAAATATGRETFYNTRAEQLAAEEVIHRAVFAVNRGLYAALLALPGVNDHTIQQGLLRLLDNPHPGDPSCFLDHDQEGRLLDHLADALPPQRLFKLFVGLARARVNNKRTRRLILRAILGSSKLPFWAVKYRLKLRAALRHALGTGVANGLRELTALADPQGTDRARLAKYLDRYLPAGADRDTVRQCVCFILGGRREYTLPLLRAFTAARADLNEGATLPVEVLGGICSRFHKDVPQAQVLELAKKGGGITEGQKLAMQRAAARQDVDLEFDPQRADMLRLYVYALECGMTPEVRAALDDKARRLAQGLPLRYGRVGIIVDASASMAGTGQGKYRPLAIALAMRDVLAASASEARVRASQGTFDAGGLVRPEGDTSLAEALAELLQEDLDAVYLLTDGYENAPAGRADEVIRALRALGVQTPVYQFTPVLAGETAGLRAVSPAVAPLPVSRPEALGLALVRAALHQDVEQGIAGLLALARPLLERRA